MNAIIMIFFISGSVWLQIFLSKRQNKWLGLIIPSISFAFSLLIMFGSAIFTGMRTTSMAEVDSSLVTNIYVTSKSGNYGVISRLVILAPVFLIYNIPTIIYLAIYFACREKIKLRSELDKMNIQDLE